MMKPKIQWDAAAEPSSWTWLTPAEREDRNKQILEWWAMGYSREWIATRVDLTPQRVSQIINDFGVGWR